MTPTDIGSLQHMLEQAPMSQAQKIAVAMTVLLSAIDGYDALSISFAAPAIAREWQLGPESIGVLLASGLAGMATGSLLLAPRADYLGRRPLLAASVLITSLGCFLCALAEGTTALAGWRFVAGIGIGACISLINPLSAEFANVRWRPMTVSAMAMGYPVGAIVGGVIAASLLRLFGWREIFLVGGAATLAMLPLILAFVPEPLAYLIGSTRADRLVRVNALLARFGHPPVAVLEQAPRRARGYRLIFVGPQIATTAWITIINLLVAANVYYVLSWLPQLVVAAGFGASVGSLASTTMGVTGVIGGLAFGVLALKRARRRHLAAAVVTGFGGSTILLGLVPDQLPLLLGAAALSGFFLYASASAVYSTLAECFSDDARAAGTGFVIGVGRIVSALAPLIAGMLFARGFSRSFVTDAFGLSVIAAGALLLLSPRRR